MPGQLDRFSDDQIERFLKRVRTSDLLALLNVISSDDRQRVVDHLSAHSSYLVERATSENSEGSTESALRLLNEIADQRGPCIFCRIDEGELPGSFVHRDDNLMIIMDLQPVTLGHALVIPRSHAEFLSDLSGDAASMLMTSAQKLGTAMMRSDLGLDGFNLMLANGGAAGQDVFHVHLHVIPRYHGDEFGFVKPPGYPSAGGRADLDANAERIKKEFATGG